VATTDPGNGAAGGAGDLPETGASITLALVAAMMTSAGTIVSVVARRPR
jgi:LPXTG-motif cell wall-anchored protein